MTNTTYRVQVGKYDSNGRRLHGNTVLVEATDRDGAAITAKAKAEANEARRVADHNGYAATFGTWTCNPFVVQVEKVRKAPVRKVA